jgi:hypothetical protein
VAKGANMRRYFLKTLIFPGPTWGTEINGAIFLSLKLSWENNRGCRISRGFCGEMWGGDVHP